MDLTTVPTTKSTLRGRSAPELSVVVPLFNERDGLVALAAEIERACESIGLPWELIFVDDGSTDGSGELLAELVARDERIIGVRLRRNFGKSAALMAGFDHSSGEIVVTLDGDGQDDPAEIPKLVRKLDEGYSLVSGWKRERRDPAVRRWASRLFNRITSRLSGVTLHDHNCGLKAYRRDCVRELQIYGELHRYIPVLAAQRGWPVTELPVNHRPRLHGRTKFGFARYMRGPFDLLNVLFIGRYQHRPLHLFGGLGVALMLAGIAISTYLAVLWLGGEGVGDRPLLLLGVLLIVVGIQLLTSGLLGQMLVAMRQEGVAGHSSDSHVERVVGERPVWLRTDPDRDASR
jgi:glycosyltransferase involved in cell wall biosynthesis